MATSDSLVLLIVCFFRLAQRDSNQILSLTHRIVGSHPFIYSNDQTMNPSIVIVGLDQIFLDEIIHGLAGEKQSNEQNLIEWTIDTKYYTADVNLCPVNKKMLVDESVANSAQILVLLIDPLQVRIRFFFIEFWCINGRKYLDK